jgi:hypothetical protein
MSSLARFAVNSHFCITPPLKQKKWGDWLYNDNEQSEIGVYNTSLGLL